MAELQDLVQEVKPLQGTALASFIEALGDILVQSSGLWFFSHTRLQGPSAIVISQTLHP